MFAQYSDNVRGQILSLLQSGLAVVDGREVTRVSLAKQPISKSFYLISVGKCALAMATGAHEACSEQIIASLIVTKDEPLTSPLCKQSNVHSFASAHPVPDLRSIHAGQALLQFIANTPEDANLVFFISGGASSLVEVLSDAISIEEVAQINAWLLAHNFTIHEINAIRKRLSLIKGGGLLAYLKQRKCLVKLISDVPGDVISNIGSGWFFPKEDNVDLLRLPEWMHQLLTLTSLQVKAHAQIAKVSTEIIARNSDALRTIANVAIQSGLTVHWQESHVISGDVNVVAEELVTIVINGLPGLYLWGGETTITLPDNPGKGGRNQHLALLMAKKLQGYDNIVFASLASDGNDGSGDDAGAIVDGQTLRRGFAAGCDVDDYLRCADSGSYLAQSGDLIHTGPTGTNVMDIILAIKSA